MEMEAEAIMLQRASPISEGRPLRNEALAWAKLFDRRYIDRTLVGVMVMFFQRECCGLFNQLATCRKVYFRAYNLISPFYRMEWHQCSDILRSIAHAQPWA